MYNDEHNLYHYTYRKDGSEAEAHSAPQPGPVQDHNSGPQQPVQEMKPVKKNRIGLKVTALALCCALLGGAVGGGIVWGVGRSGDETSVNVSGILRLRLHSHHGWLYCHQLPCGGGCPDRKGHPVQRR